MREEENEEECVCVRCLFELAIAHLARLDPPILYEICGIVGADIHDAHNGCDERDEYPVDHRYQSPSRAAYGTFILRHGLRHGLKPSRNPPIGPKGDER